MKALFVGLGSIGCRHLKNLASICESRQIPLEAVALRSSDRPLPEEVAALLQGQYKNLPGDERYDLAFITNPTSQHAVALGALKGQVEAFFIEKPLFDQPDYDLELLGLGDGQKAYVAAPLRWTGVYAALKQAVQQGCRPFSARAICSSYLPEWRQDVDYRRVYSASRALGGGVSLDLIHEWDYLYDLLGPPLEVHNLRGQYSALEVDSDDLSVYIARWESLLGEVHLDYFGRGFRRSIELLCEDGTLTADFGGQSLSLPNGTRQDCAEDANQKFMREMDYFLNYALAGVGESLSSPKRALAVLKTALSGA